MPAEKIARVTLLAGLFLASVALAERVEAQVPVFSFELRGGVATGSDPDGPGLGSVETELGTGASFDVAFALRMAKRLVIVAGFGERRIECASDPCAPGSDFVATGFDFAARVPVLPTRRVTPWIRVGGRSQKVVVDIVSAGEGRIERTSRRGTSLEVGAGLFWRVSDRVAIAPEARYFRGTADLRDLGEVPLRGVVVDMGLVLVF